jgi:tRNA threonylcarbamoyladenosine biosynthesis protein TsaE
MRPAAAAPGNPPAGPGPVESRSTDGPEATAALGAEIARRLRAGDVVLLRGDLGAGKTTLVRGAAAALGADARVTSPTFALAHRYDGDGVRIAHLDLYRLGGGALGEDDEDLLADELAGDVVAFVEWPGPVEALLADRVALEVDLAHAGDDRRDAALRWRAER